MTNYSRISRVEVGSRKSNPKENIHPPYFKRINYKLLQDGVTSTSNKLNPS